MVTYNARSEKQFWGLKLFYATLLCFVNADLGSQKALHTFLTKCLYLMLAKFERNRIV